MDIISAVGASGGDDPYSSVRTKLLQYGIRDVDFVDDQETSTVQIRGTVNTYYQKQMAQTMLMDLVGRTKAIRIENKIEVRK